MTERPRVLVNALPTPPATAEAPGRLLEQDGSLAHGVVVDTVIVARVFRVPLLRLEGNVILSPGRLVPVSEPTPSQPALPAPRAAVPVVEQDASNGVIGAGLDEAARTLARLRGD